MTTRRFVFLSVLLLSGAAFAADTAPASLTPPAAPTSATASAPASAPAIAGRFAVKDTDGLKIATGKEATVFGEISRISPSPSGSLTFVNFKGLQRGDFSVIIKKENKDVIDKAFDGDLTKALKGKSVEITGVILDYQGHPEIEVTKPGQIKIVETAATAASQPVASQPAKTEK